MPDTAPVTLQATPTTANRRDAIIAYVLCLVGFVSIITCLVALVWAYIRRSDAEGTIYESHFQNVITTFWTSLMLVIIGFVLLFVAVGYLVFLGTFFWCLYRYVKGITRALDGKPFND
ncbi:DUF4870 family protein [Aliagarivorans taiwanensis]|uniref:DUF4870 family protein n=1 Tax=Aliagarivorans taiwanensis TaxID=561966 RepID=UPI0006865CF6|nr:hypothetical protein [Aliagarivorans taiwanensis]